MGNLAICKLMSKKKKNSFLLHKQTIPLEHLNKFVNTNLHSKHNKL